MTSGLALAVALLVLLAAAAIVLGHRRRRTDLARNPDEIDRVAQRETHPALQDAEARYRQLFEQSPDGILLLDSETGRVIEANAKAAEQLGYTREEFAASRISDWEALEEPEETAKHIQAILREGSDEFDTLHRTRSGEIRNVHVWTKTHLVEGRACFFAVFRDITDRRKAEVALRASEDRYRDLVESSQDLICTHGLAGDILTINQATSRLSGYPVDALLQMNLADLLVPEKRPLFGAYLAELETEGRAHGIMKIRTASGETRFWQYNNTLRTENVKAPLVRAMAQDVTERMRAERALRESVDRFDLASRATFNILWDHDLRTNLIWRNDNFQEVFGYSPSEVGPGLESWIHLIHPEDVERVESGFQAALASDREIWSDEYRVRRRDGTYSVVEDRGRITRDASGRPTRLVGAMQDITERKRAEAELRSSRALLEAIREAQAGFLAGADPHATFEQLLQALLVVTGSEYGFIAEVPPRPGGRPYLRTLALTNIAWSPRWQEFYDKHAPQGLELHNLETLFGAAITSGQPVLANEPATDPRSGGLPPGHPELRAFLGLPFFHADEVVGMVGMANREGGYDESQIRSLAPFLSTCSSLIAARRLDRQRQQAEIELRLQSAALEAAANAIIITDRGGTVVWVNPAFTALSGYSSEEAVGKSPGELIKSGVHDRAFYEQLWNTLLAGEVWSGEMTNRRKDGSFYPEEQTITPVRDDRGEITHFIGIKRDLTQQHQLEIQFVQAQKMESVGQLAAGIAHDFNNLLTVINGTASLASAELRDGDPRRADLLEIQRAGERAAALTRQLLAFGRKQILNPEILNLNTVVSDIEDLLRRLSGDNIHLVLELAGGLDSVLADPGQIEQVVLNLAVNARDAMPDGGTLTIETGNVELDDAFAAMHPSEQPGPRVELTVRDTGVGMDEATCSRVFEPFFTTKGLGKGTGLGLSTVYGIVKQSGGSIWADSEPGKGTTFRILLPRVEEGSEGARLPRTTTSPHGSETILVVDDETTLRHLAARLLQSVGYAVLTAGDGGEALRLLEGNEGSIHLMITDVVMPGMSGSELAARVGAISPKTKVLFTSGYSDDAIVRQGVLEEGTHFIGKPFTLADLTRKVRDVLDA